MRRLARQLPRQLIKFDDDVIWIDRAYNLQAHKWCYGNGYDWYHQFKSQLSHEDIFSNRVVSR